MSRNQMINTICTNLVNKPKFLPRIFKSEPISRAFINPRYAAVNWPISFSKRIKRNRKLYRSWIYPVKGDESIYELTSFEYSKKIGYILHCLCSNSDLEQLLWELN